LLEVLRRVFTKRRSTMREYDYEESSSAMPAFIAGALIGAGLALLFAPQTGSQLRRMLRDYASQAGDDLYERGREALDTAVERGRGAWDTAVERGKEYLESGKGVMREAGRTTREYMESGKEAVKEAGRELNKEASRRM
jgi:gas vesicle protein